MELEGTFAEMGVEDVVDYALPDAASGGSSTQLSEQFPQIDTPLRVDPPVTLKAPPRAPPLTRDHLIRDSAFAPKAFRTMQRHKTQPLPEVTPPPGNNGARAKKAAKVESSLKGVSQAQGHSKNALSDNSILAFSSQRAGKVQMEGQAYLAMAISHDNMEQYAEAVEAYKKFLAVCQKVGDPVVEGLACNCLGVDYMYLACPLSQGSPFESCKTLSEDARLMLLKATECHQRHLEVADEGGKFVAASNLGLSFGLLGDFAVATQHHQEALRIAIRLQSYSGQGVAVGNLGMLAMRQGEVATGQACMEQHLELVQSLKDAQAESNAWLQLGGLYSMAGTHGQAVHAFESAVKLAEGHGEVGLLKRAICLSGVARGKLSMAQHMAKLGHFAKVGYKGADADEPVSY